MLAPMAVSADKLVVTVASWGKNLRVVGKFLHPACPGKHRNTGRDNQASSVITIEPLAESGRCREN
jgi:hypothetical protein